MLVQAVRAMAITCVAALAVGCFNPAVEIYQRSALEQQLTRAAIWRTIQRLAVHKAALEGKWKVMVLAPNPRDESWIRGALILRLYDLGVNVVRGEHPDASTIVAGVVYAGMDIDNFAVGIPIPGGDGRALAFYQSVTERGRAQMFLSFMDAQGAPIGTTDPVERDAHYTAIYVLTAFGPLALTDIDINTADRFSEMGMDTIKHGRDAAILADQWIMPPREEEEADAANEAEEK